MNKSVLLYVGIFMSALIVTSCSNEEKNVAQVQTVSPVLKTARMLSFESSLKIWFNARNDNGTSLAKTTAKNNATTVIEENSKKLLAEMGFDSSIIENKVSDSSEKLVTFTMEEYSKKLTMMYNQNNK